MKKDENPMNRILRNLSEGGLQPDCLKQVVKDFRKRKQWTEDTRRQFLNSLAECLILPGGAEAIARKCPQILLPLLSVASSQPFWQQHGIIVLGNLAKLHPDAARFALQHLKGPQAPFHIENLEPPRAKKMKIPDKPPTQYELLKASLALLQTNRSHFAQLWNWSPVIDLLNCTDNKIRWLACESLALLLGMPEKARHALQSHLFPEKVRQQFALQECVVPQEPLYVPESSEDSCEELEKLCSLCPNVVCVAGVVLPALPNRVPKPEVDLEMVASTQANLRSLAVAAAAGRPVLLQGPVGCGKTALVEYLASLTGRTGPPDLLKVQLGDETDSKMLLGAYCCTEVPGEFIWQPGVLTQAIQRGAWLLLEDIDCAGMDVISVLASLIETNTLSVPGYRDCVRAAPTFQLFATQRLTQGSEGFHRTHSSPSAVLDDLWLQLSVEPLARHELNTIIESKFTALAPVASRLLDVFLLFSQGSHAMALEAAPLSRAATGMDEAPQPSTSGAVGRLISTRDLLKWCSRVEKGFDSSSPDCALRILQDAIDLFCCSSSSPEETKQQAIAVAGRLGIVSTKAEFYCSQYKPTVTINPTKVIAGRATIPRLTSVAAGLQSSTAVFSLTRAASCLLERVACCVARAEPVLLVGETGAGKTATVQLLAQRAGRHLRVINMNQHSDSADLLGGFKPVDLKLVIGPVREEFERLFCITFKREPNLKFLHHVASCFSARRWDALLTLMRHSLNAALKKTKEDTLVEWQHLSDRMERLESQLKAGHASLAFSFIEGALVRAVVTGEWVLLDEINLASAETLQCLSGLLEGSTGSLHLLERGDEKPITRHPEFRLFACMNPATDVGKKDLPPGLRNRFTELFVEELSDKTDLIQLAACYLGGLGIKASRLESLVKLYLQLRIEANKNLASETGHKPHFSLRTFCRALSVAASNPCGSVSRSLLEAFNLSFLTQLDRPSQQVVEDLIIKAVCGKESKSILNQPLPEPSSGVYNKVEGFWVQQGDEEVHIPDKYILTLSVRGHLKALARAVSLGRAPVLLQGETSVGKTSLVSYLAQITGHRCLRINNHEHTDLQEYLGQYVVGTDGQLTFKEGALVEAMRKGHWVILDELNLAPSDVLEALNRVLDDNRELFIPETQTLVQAHPRFMLFATQNPPGLYGGRKLLSRAFRNRFVELHFGEIPSKELEIILQERCALPASYAKKMVAVMGELQIRRRGSAAFAGKQGFMTLRDLFRWGERYRLASIDSKSKHNWEQHLADEGYLVLAGRVRRAEEALVIQEAVKKHLRCQLDPDYLFTLNSNTSAATKDILEVVTKASLPGFEHIVWTFNMRRLAVLVGKAVQFSEPALLVGETGCGKTSVCQLLAALKGHSLLSVNCHMHTEAADFLGSLRPVRDHQDKDHLFEWMDGPLVQAMSNGDWFLADEISLADDSVLERLNSLLEPERSLLLAEKGGECTVTAEPSFQFVATMNPGGDFGKKELSPALRNRLTEVWCEGCESQADRVAVVERSVRPGLALGNQQDGTSGIGHCSAAFVKWLQSTELGSRLTVSVRDLLTWVHFINVVSEQVSTGQTTALDLGSAYVHGACLTFLDSLGSGVTSGASGATVAAARKAAIQFLNEQIVKETGQPPDYNPLADEACKIHTSESYFGMKPFFIEKGQDGQSGLPNNFLFEAPSTCISVLRLLRALQLSKPVLLEGSPGVGKTSLVHAVANAAGHPITRINLSDQTDASDLFGADLPVEGGVGGQFAWRDGPFLQALKAGHWIVLDELNLASQSVLEALNACLDHRGEVYIPELGRSFQVQAKSTRLFACQNPQRQGGARRGLPRSFLNRFTQVYIEALTPSDLNFIANSSFPDLPQALLSQMVSFSCRVAHETGELRTWGSRGGPWEMNLRDLSRWAMAARVTDDCNLGPEAAAKLIYVERMRTQEDRLQMAQVFEEEVKPLPVGLPRVAVTPEYLKVGGVRLPRGDHCQVEAARELLLLRSSLPTLHALATCVHHNWLAILVGGPGSGKSSSVSLLAGLAGRPLRVLAVNSAMDTTEILGGFEQTDLGRHLDELATTVQTCVSTKASKLLASRIDDEARAILQAWEAFQNASSHEETKRTLSAETRFFQQRAELLERVLIALGSEGSDLLLQLKDVVARAKSAGTLNAGGRFEWVDSVLVKCLREGSWLLLENVNLCSAAVLDRLNALLEPGGSLVLGERGARSDGGGLHVVTPHPDFRLFFTMDPRHGDISRAMRNRGVEIFVPGPGEDAPPLDLKALLANAGVTAYAEQQALLAAHRTLKALVTGTEAVPSLPWLLRAAFLVRQNVLRGAGGSARALYFACLDVYVKPRASAEAKRQALAALEEVLASSSLTALPQDLLPSSATLQVAALQENSSLAAIQQQGSVLSTVLATLARHSAQSSSFLNQLCHLPSESRDAPLEHLVSPLLLAFYFGSSAADVQLRHSWLISRAPHMQATSHKLCSVIQELSLGVQPWDMRWQGDMDTPDASLAARLSLLLQFLVLQANESKSQATNSKELSVLKYSQLLAERRVSDSLTNSPVVTQLSRLLTLLDLALVVALREEQLTPTDVETLRRGLHWRSHLRSYADSCIISAACVSQVTSALIVHARWLAKKLLSPLFQVSGTNSASVSLELKTLLVELDLDGDQSALCKVARKVLPRLSQPLPYSSKLQTSACLSLDLVVKEMQLWPAKDKSKWLQLSTWLATPVGAQTRQTIITTLAHLQLRQDITEDAVINVEQLTKELSATDVLTYKSLGGELLAKEYLCLLLATRLRLEMLQSRGQVETLLNQLAAMFNTTATAPLKVQAAIRAIIQQLATGSCTSSSKHHLLSCLLEWQTRYSPATTAPALWLDWSHSITSNEENFNILTRQLQVHQEQRNLSIALWCPLLSYIVTQETLGKDETLGESETHARKLNSLGHLVWCGTQASSTSMYDVRSIEVECIKAAFSQFLTAVHPTSTGSFSDRVVQWRDSSLPLASLLNTAEQLATLVDSLELNCDIANVGQAWVLLGSLNLSLAAAWPTMDPVQSRALKLKYIESEMEEGEHTLYAHELVSRVVGESSSEFPQAQHPHPLLTSLREHCQSLIEQRNKLATYVAVRPEPSQYSELQKMVRRYSGSIGSTSTVLELSKQLLLATQRKSSVSGILLNQEESWQASQRKFCEDLSAAGSLYPDLIQPVLYAANQMSHGMSLLSNQVKRISEQRDLSHLGQACRLPAFNSSMPSHLALARATNSLIHTASSDDTTLTMGLQMSTLEELRNDVIAFGQIRPDCVSTMTRLMGQLAETWMLQEQERKQKERESQSLYKVQHKQEEAEVQEAFPSYHREFEDLAPGGNDTLNAEPMQIEEPEPVISSAIHITLDDLSHIGQLHSEVFQGYTHSDWLSSPTPSFSPHHARPLLLRLQALKLILPSTLSSLDSKFDQDLIGSCMLLLRHGGHDPEPNPRPHDFYRDPLPSETVRCRPLLVAIKKRVNELMQEWPEHPTLLTLDKVCVRLLGFSSQSPVAKMLCGLELLLSQLQDWEAHAHAGVSLGALSQATSQMVLEWRRMELQQWSEALSTVQDRFERHSLGRWWCHLVSLLLEEPSNESDLDKLLSAVQQFMEQSKLGDFSARLQLLKAFHCHTLHLPQSQHHDNLQRLLWNAYIYFSQFSHPISVQLRSKRAPIEKKLKEIVKISRWTDTNYWALRQTTMKTHRTLHKHMKEFQDVLVEPATSAMTVSGVPKVDWTASFQPSDFLSSLTPKASTDEGLRGVPQASRWFKKAQKLSKELLLTAPYPHRIHSLFQFASDITDTTKLVQSQNVPAPQSDKKQRKSQVKHLLQCKRKVVADTFRALTRIGLSYRTGMAHQRNPIREAFLAEPLDIEASIGNSTNNADASLLYAWQGCSSLLAASLARLAQLRAALEKPSSDLGPVGLDKCHGFSLHLMELVQEQYGLVADVWSHMLSLRKQFEILNSLPVISSQSFIEPHKAALSAAATCSSWLDQFSLMLRCLPEPSESSEQEFLPGFPSPTSQQISEALAITSDLKAKIQAVKTALLSVNLDLPLISSTSAQALQNVGSKLSSIATSLSTLTKFSPSSVTEGLEWVQQRLESAAEALNQCSADTDSGEGTENVGEHAEKLHTQALLLLQRLYQHHTKPDPETGPLEDEDDELLEEGHLKVELVTALKRDIADLKLQELDAAVKNLVTVLAASPASAQLVQSCMPLLDQVLLVVHYLVVQLTGSLQASSHLLCELLSLTTLLAHKGFNMPEEEKEEESGDGPTQPASGLGLGEGEGEKNVSDRLESEDQLEGARQEGEEEEEPADKDVKEEDGVEVSEDFEGKLQDREPAPEGEGSDQEQEEKDEDDTGQEIGETGEDAECLDKQVWGSDSEEEEEEMGETDKGRGEEKDDVVPEVGAAGDEEGPEQQNQKDWDAQEQQEFPEDQADNQHGKAPPLQEPEPLDLPDDLQLDGGEDEGEGNGEDETENPFETQELTDIKESTEVKETDQEEPAKDEGSDEEGGESGSEGEQEEEQAATEECKEPGAEDEKLEKGTAQEEEMPPESDTKEEDPSKQDEEEGTKGDKSETPAEAAPAQGTTDSSAQNDNAAPQQEQHASGDAGEDRGQEGAAQAEEGHASASQMESKMAAPASEPQSTKKEPRERRRPGEADSTHTLGDVKEPAQKRLRLAEGTADNEQEEDEDQEQSEQDKNEGELHQHIKEAKDHTTQTMDAATQEQARQQQPTVGKEDETGEEPQNEDLDIPEEDAEEVPTSSTKELRSEKTEVPGQKGRGEGDIEGTEEEKITVEGENVSTMGAQRGGGCSFHTLPQGSEEERKDLTPEEVAELRVHLEQQLASWTQPPASAEAAQAWSQFSAATSGLARDLCEQLRLVLEPTQASRLRGDYRTGRRINMRKVIPYIASEFRKDKIWLRRTRPSRRTYQVVLALDDSSSMADNHSKELAFESLALVSQALTLLEAGELGVLSFGEEPHVLHPLGQPFTEDSGARLVQQLSFSQRHTRVGRLVSFATSLLTSCARHNPGAELAQLLVIVSDGRGVFSEGKDAVHQAVRAAREARVFIVFLAIEDPNSKDSILDIRMPVFSGGKLLGISSYLDNFPFPYYLILRDVESLPTVLSDALRQWFELTANALRQ